ncbi:MAG: glycoside hydrolase [Desulfovibrio sp.]|nr:MAG: glycoside hydrolase [Desulfovibrio sp.]
MSLKKQFLKNDMCKVTFRIPPEAAPQAKEVTVVGEFNNWDQSSEPMRRLKSGEFTTTVKMDSGREYQFRYLVDGMEWINDWEADRYEYSSFGNCENSVVSV